jgi:hypothetical protein
MMMHGLPLSRGQWMVWNTPPPSPFFPRLPLRSGLHAYHQAVLQGHGEGHLVAKVLPCSTCTRTPEGQQVQSQPPRCGGGHGYSASRSVYRAPPGSRNAAESAPPAFPPPGRPCSSQGRGEALESRWQRGISLGKQASRCPGRRPDALPALKAVYLKCEGAGSSVSHRSGSNVVAFFQRLQPPVHQRCSRGRPVHPGTLRTSLCGPSPTACRPPGSPP